MCEFVGWCALTQEAQAAWAQAILSAIAILIASAFPTLSERSRKLERITLYLNMIGLAFHRASVDSWNVSQRIGSPANQRWDMKDWDRIVRMIEGIQHHELPDAELVSILDDVHAATVNFRELWARLVERKSTSFPILTGDLDSVKRCRDEIQESYERTLRVRRRHSWVAPLDALKYRMFLRKLRRELAAKK